MAVAWTTRSNPVGYWKYGGTDLILPYIDNVVKTARMVQNCVELNVGTLKVTIVCAPLCGLRTVLHYLSERYQMHGCKYQHNVKKQKLL